MARILNVFNCCSTLRERCLSGSSPFTFMDIFLTFLSIGSFLADIGTDIIVIIQYYMNGHITWMLLTTSLVCVPSLVVQTFSIRWYIIDGTVSTFLWIIHVFQLGVFQRYIQLLFLGLKVREENTHMNLKKFNQQQSDICMLRLFESFMESAPQLVLQLYIMVTTDKWNPWTGISAVASILSLSWGIAAYSKAMRNVRPEKNHLSWWGLLFQSLWRIGMVSSRVFSMVLFAVAYGFWLILAMFLHWISMTIWVFYQDTDFCTTWLEERLYNGVVGIIYCFCYFNIKEGNSRYRMSVYYFLVISQDISFLLAFYYVEKSAEGLKYFMTFLVPSGIVVGITSLLLYYRFFHPSGPIEFFQSKSPKKTEIIENADLKDSECDCCTLKTCRKLRYSENECAENSLTMSAENFATDHEEILNASRGIQMLTKSLENISSPCRTDLHRSHSLNCSRRSYDMNKINDSSYCAANSRKSLAHHHRNVNYHFRPAVNHSVFSSKIHCSCLVLTKDSYQDLYEISLMADPKFSTSLPNLEISFECENSQERNTSLMNYFTDISYSNASSFSDGNLNFIRQPEHGPIIHDYHIIRINV